ncbi:hypothetical protein GWI33_021110 [Rhynchophorus ferrugineus]|uniref:Uncharacterized protein n=1 Tax=Rhynchophorus ferrugineus TaxID=354439 RepID=A0A834M536_RHYFE|nr:hypothetical protein GWI33_021110 [Rhynchophorus ferrugineus]
MHQCVRKQIHTINKPLSSHNNIFSVIENSTGWYRVLWLNRRSLAIWETCCRRLTVVTPYRQPPVVHTPSVFCSPAKGESRVHPEGAPNGTTAFVRAAGWPGDLKFHTNVQKRPKITWFVGFTRGFRRTFTTSDGKMK